MENLRKKSSESLNDVWVRIFKHYKILEKVETYGFFEIAADDLKLFHEPRLLCKIDFENKQPIPFKNNQLSILAISNGYYKIAPTNPFFNLNLSALKELPVIKRTLPEYITSIDVKNISSESQALDAAAASGILADFQGEDSILTIRGRRRSCAFKFELSGIDGIVVYDVEGVQIEVDGGYEGKKSILLIEAKNTISKSMNIRQTLYPQVHYEKELSKEIKSAILFYDRSKRIFNFIPLKFTNSSVSPNYQSAKRYKLEQIKSQDKTSHDLSFLDTETILTDTKAPFPQANDFSKVLHVLDKLVENDPISKDELLIDLDVKVVGRQFNYYTDVLKWMRLVSGENSQLSPTDRARRISELSEKDKLLALEKIIFSDPLALEMLHKKAKDLSKDLLNTYRISGTTPRRRQSTILRWRKYFDEYKESFSNN